GVVIAQRHEQHFLTEAPNLMATVFLCRSQNSEFGAGVLKNSCRGLRDFLHAIVERGDAVDEVQRLGSIAAIENFDAAGFCPFGSLLLQLAVRIAAALERFQWFLQ